MSRTKIEVGDSAHDVLRFLYEKGPMRQNQIAEFLNVSVAASNRQFKKLAEEQLITHYSTPTSCGGRPSQSWQINNEKNCFLGIVFSDDTISAMLIDFDGRSRWHKSQPVTEIETQKQILKKLIKIADLAGGIAQENQWAILQCFIGIPGLMSTDGTVLNSVNHPALNGLNLEKELKGSLGVKIFCDGMQHAIVLSETNYLSPDSTALIIEWSDGFGGLVASGQKLLSWPAIYPRRRRGIWNMGHIRIKQDGRNCHCGNRGCLEAYIGGRALREQYPKLKCASDIELVKLAKSKNLTAIQVLSDAARLIAESLYWTIELFGIDSIIFTGVFSEAFDVYEEAFKDGLRVLHTPEELLGIKLMVNNDPYRNACWGAALMARQFYFYPDEPLSLRGLGRIAN